MKTVTAKFLVADGGELEVETAIVAAAEMLGETAALPVIFLGTKTEIATEADTAVARNLGYGDELLGIDEEAE